jgi:hypothetical protein
MNSALLLSVLVLPILRGMGEVPLPASDFVPGWTRVEKRETFKKEDLFNRIDGAAELFLEMGFRELVVQRYQNGDAAIDLEVYEIADPIGALGVYLHRRGKETPVQGIEGRHTGGRLQIIAQKGRYLIQVNNFAGCEWCLSAMVELTSRVLASVPEQKSKELLGLLPKEGLAAGSELFVCGPYSLQPVFTFGDGDVLKLEGKVFGVAANYQTEDRGSFALLILPYPDAPAAETAFRNLVDHLDPLLTVVRRDERRLVFKDFAGKYGVVRRVGQTLEAQLRLSRPPE